MAGSRRPIVDDVKSSLMAGSEAAKIAIYVDKTGVMRPVPVAGDWWPTSTKDQALTENAVQSIVEAAGWGIVRRPAWDNRSCGMSRKMQCSADQAVSWALESSRYKARSTSASAVWCAVRASLRWDQPQKGCPGVLPGTRAGKHCDSSDDSRQDQLIGSGCRRRLPCLASKSWQVGGWEFDEKDGWFSRYG
ncbi:uncharacterized protein LY79DRAFT_362536 [Colletotrichum navitas]|uniref:Uncharacterized protein n=1 Tax=Colletotrichum navitas TaxID=681940 RepID=A0AAD8PS40_9PEZI|nr:uncharacterized protein LY79DRAFT_362536 [Colletotrichum navitas]KAK1574688.1 hypothetical protein LY79DRAFT_362536 [Colletotrichum navitas]